MIDLVKAQQAFKNYISHYDLSMDELRLKVVHTYEVMKITEKLCQELKVQTEQTKLCLLIALLHDIGRFEQHVRYGSFIDYQTVDHAAFGCELLFKQGLIREFIEEETYDEIIYEAIYEHNKYKVSSHYSPETLFYIQMIRDADKLDNFRVKEVERIETLLHISYEELVQEDISDKIVEYFEKHQLIYGPDRQTHLDIWLSFIAFIFDFNFKVSYLYIKENDYINRSFNRITPRASSTREKYIHLREIAINYIEENC